VEETDALVIGGGITGLAAAHCLRDRLGRESVLLVEAGPEPGGTARTELRDGFVCEWGPNGFLDKEPKTLEWIDALGLTDRLVRANEAAAHRFVYRRKRLHEIKPPPGFLLSPLLSLPGRARLLCEPLIPGKTDDAPESVWSFAARRIGREAADTMVAPMISGIYGGDARQLDLASCFPRMAEMEREYGGLLKALRAIRKRNPDASPMGPRGTLTSFDRGMGVLTQTACEALGDRAWADTAATKIACDDGGYVVSLADGRAIRARAVVVAAPAFAAADLVRELDAEAAHALDGIPYAGLAVVCTGYPREAVAHALDGFGFLVPRTEGLRVLGCLWTSTLFPGRAPDGMVMLRTMYGGFTDPEAVQLDDDALIELMSEEVHPILGIESRPEFVQIFRHGRGIPQYVLGHRKRVEAIAAAEDRHPGLVFAGNAYRGVSLHDCVLSAHRAADRVSAM